MQPGSCRCSHGSRLRTLRCIPTRVSRLGHLARVLCVALGSPRSCVALGSPRSCAVQGRVVERYAQRSELMAKKRQLQNELDKQRAQVQKTERTLDAVAQQLAAFNAPSPGPSGVPDDLGGTIS